MRKPYIACSFRCDLVRLKKLTYIAHQQDITRSKLLLFLVDKRIAQYEHDHGEIPLDFEV